MTTTWTKTKCFNHHSFNLALNLLLWAPPFPIFNNNNNNKKAPNKRQMHSLDWERKCNSPNVASFWATGKNPSWIKKKKKKGAAMCELFLVCNVQQDLSLFPGALLGPPVWMQMPVI